MNNHKIVLVALFAVVLAISVSNANPIYGLSGINATDLPNRQNIPVKRVHVGDIDIAYKTFGKGEPILIVSGAGGDMNAWDPSILKVSLQITQ